MNYVDMLPEYSWEELEKMDAYSTIFEGCYDISTTFNADCLKKLGFADTKVRMMVVRGQSGILAYIGFDKSSVFANDNWRNLDFDVNGELSFGGILKGHPDYFYYGWDYCHMWDKGFNRDGNEPTCSNPYPFLVGCDLKIAVRQLQHFIIDHIMKEV